jgi:hypothetical protein
VADLEFGFSSSCDAVHQPLPSQRIFTTATVKMKNKIKKCYVLLPSVIMRGRRVI